MSLQRRRHRGSLESSNRLEGWNARDAGLRIRVHDIALFPVLICSSSDSANGHLFASSFLALLRTPALSWFRVTPRTNQRRTRQSCLRDLAPLVVYSYRKTGRCMARELEHWSIMVDRDRSIQRWIARNGPRKPLGNSIEGKRIREAARGGNSAR